MREFNNGLMKCIVLDVKENKAFIAIKNYTTQPFVIASGYKPNNTEWDSGKYYSEFSNAAYYWSCEV